MIIKRYDFVDVAKGIGIMLVVLGHVVPGDTLFCKWVYMFHMPLFFFLSGLTFNHKRNQEWGIFVKKRMRSLLLPAVYFTILSLFLSKLFVPEFYSFGSLLYGLPHAMWFLPVLFLIEILYHPLGVKCGNKIICVFILLSLFIGIVLFREAVALPYRLTTVFPGIFYYGIGHLSYRLGICDNIQKLGTKLLGGVMLLIPFIWIWYSNQSIQFWNNEIPQPEYIYVVLSLTGVAGMLMISNIFIGNAKSVFVYIGNNTMTILCTHMFYIAVFRHYLYKTEDSLFIPIEIILLFAISYMTIIFVNIRAPWIIGKTGNNYK